MWSRTLLYLHPVAALVALALAVYAATLGFRSRSVRRDADEARRRHARIGPWLWALVVANWLGGIATVWWLRPDIDLADSGHWTLGTAVTALFTLTALVSRFVRSDERARLVHPVLGAVSVILSGVQVFLGLQLLP
jgi:hypothetical protein